ncbi:hypothetical protein FJQ98_14185 [Lysinibacillus agricola]|uniref:Uncharacterized protein n=1 Tax=Lysinibacillus agricola TaxID=2590012 RepID=A0ABX7AKT5_9BACI|nr:MULTISPECIES: hypothetical protein [Lysinibacillus]KOS64640.1 hypothetical protein AN161_01045 [Lysinibacillus sp. FJAT-14222]QQP10437.1 hypothetical protein FJQ98_14185 [Lysinibacillus agricola]
MDIVVTIPKNEYENDDRETAVFDQGGYEQFWQLSRRPKNLNIGDRVYFVKNRRIESSMGVKRIEEKTTASCDVTNRNWSGCLIFMDDLRQEYIPNIKGFQGFHYRWW